MITVTDEMVEGCNEVLRQHGLVLPHAVLFPALEAALLISAAPEMYEALPDLSFVITWLRNGCDPETACIELEIYQARITAAKAKAGGRS